MESKRNSARLAALVTGVAIASNALPAYGQSLLSSFKHAVADAIAKKAGAQPQSTPGHQLPNSGDGVHSQTLHFDWNYPGFAPHEINGYLHLRMGTASLDQFNNAVPGHQTCDDIYLGYAALGRPSLSDDDARRCVSLERMDDSTATMQTVQKRMVEIAQQLATSGKFYTRGTVQQIYTGTNESNNQSIPPGQAVLRLGCCGGHTIGSPSGTYLLQVGPNWYLDLSDSYELRFDASPELLTQWGQMARASYVYYTVKPAKNGRPSPAERGITEYDVPVEVNKIVLEANGHRVELAPEPLGKKPHELPGKR